jgi:hypothetical protein
MAQKQDRSTTLPGVFATLSAGFELTTRYLWLMVIPALLDLFLWIGPRLSFRPLIESLFAQLPVEAMLIDPGPLLAEAVPRLNHFTYLGVPLLGVPALMTGLTPEQTPIQPAVVERAGWGEWFGYLLLFTVIGLLLAAVFYSFIAYALRRSGAPPGEAPGLTVGRFGRRIARTWLRLLVLTTVMGVLIMALLVPISLLAGFVALINQMLASVVLLGALIVILWVVLFFGYTPQGMTLNPRGFLSALGDSIRLFQKNLPASLGLLFVVVLARQLLSNILLSADSGTWVTVINILAHAYISTALVVALFIFYRDRYLAFLQGLTLHSASSPTGSEQAK